MQRYTNFVKSEDESTYGNKQGLISSILPWYPRITDQGMTAGFYENGKLMNLKFSWKSSYVSLSAMEMQVVS